MPGSPELLVSTQPPMAGLVKIAASGPERARWCIGSHVISKEDKQVLKRFEIAGDVDGGRQGSTQTRVHKDD